MKMAVIVKVMLIIVELVTGFSSSLISTWSSTSSYTLTPGNRILWTCLNPASTQSIEIYNSTTMRSLSSPCQHYVSHWLGLVISWEMTITMNFEKNYWIFLQFIQGNIKCSDTNMNNAGHYNIIRFHYCLQYRYYFHNSSISLRQWSR